MSFVQKTDSYKQLNVEIIELKLQLENETRLKLQAERDLETKHSELSENSTQSAEVKFDVLTQIILSRIHKNSF